MTERTLTFDHIRISKQIIAPPAVRICQSPLLIDRTEDWSRVRSPGRAARRRHRHRQNIRIVEAPKPGGIVIDGVLWMHPVTFDAFNKQVGDRLQRQMDGMLLGLFAS